MDRGPSGNINFSWCQIGVLEPQTALICKYVDIEEDKSRTFAYLRKLLSMIFEGHLILSEKINLRFLHGGWNTTFENKQRDCSCFSLLREREREISQFLVKRYIGIFLFDPSKISQTPSQTKRSLVKIKLRKKKERKKERKKEERKEGRKEGKKEKKRGIVRWQRRVSGYELRTVQR